MITRLGKETENLRSTKQSESNYKKINDRESQHTKTKDRRSRFGLIVFFPDVFVTSMPFHSRLRHNMW